MIVAGVLLSTTTIIFGISLSFLILISAGIGLLFSTFLILIQLIKIKDYCFYCMVSALITLILFLNSLILWMS